MIRIGIDEAESEEEEQQTEETVPEELEEDSSAVGPATGTILIGVIVVVLLLVIALVVDVSCYFVNKTGGSIVCFVSSLEPLFILICKRTKREAECDATLVRCSVSN